jgi:hypothetical protein
VYVCPPPPPHKHNTYVTRVAEKYDTNFFTYTRSCSILNFFLLCSATASKRILQNTYWFLQNFGKATQVFGELFVNFKLYSTFQQATYVQFMCMVQ